MSISGQNTTPTESPKAESQVKVSVSCSQIPSLNIFFMNDALGSELLTISHLTNFSRVLETLPQTRPVRQIKVVKEKKKLRARTIWLVNHQIATSSSRK